MAAADDRRDPPLLNPVLALRKEPVPEAVTGGGKGADAIVTERLERQRRELAASIERIAVEASSYAPHAGRIHLVARMFPDSQAPSWTPAGLFDPRFACRLVAPAHHGYLVEFPVNQLPPFARFIRRTDTIEAKVAISRVSEIRPFDAQELLRGKPAKVLWDHATEVDGGRGFIVWLAPYQNDDARASVIQTLARLERGRVLLPTFPGLALSARLDHGSMVPIVTRGQTGLARAIRRYRNDGVARTFVAVPTERALVQLATSGTSFRIDPVRKIEVTSPGDGSEPAIPVPSAATQPVVAVVDGGLTARSYLPMEAWRAPPLVIDRVADYLHGNRVTSLVVHAHAWNNRLPLPELTCRVATVSSLSAHTFANLKEPSGDLVRALLINMAEGERHDPALGWGTPWNGHSPWTCSAGSVTLAWRAKLRPGYAYYWNDLPIPSELIRNGKLVGSGKLTAILTPVVSPTGGPNYFVTRLQVALQYQQINGSWGNLLGTMKEDKAAELDARIDLAKWHPVRRMMRDFSKRGGIGFRGTNFRLHARVFARDLFQFGFASHHELGEQEAAFVLTLSDGSDSSGIYNSMAQRLTNFVESAVVGQEIEIEGRP